MCQPRLGVSLNCLFVMHSWSNPTPDISSPSSETHSDVQATQCGLKTAYWLVYMHTWYCRQYSFHSGMQGKAHEIGGSTAPRKGHVTPFNYSIIHWCCNLMSPLSRVDSLKSKLPSYTTLTLQGLTNRPLTQRRRPILVSSADSAQKGSSPEKILLVTAFDLSHACINVNIMQITT